jgi:hypothetical protein
VQITDKTNENILRIWNIRMKDYAFRKCLVIRNNNIPIGNIYNLAYSFDI